MYQVLSPDGFQIMVQGEITFSSLKKAKQALSQWVKSFITQGYYSQVCYNGYRRQISLNHLPDYCDIIKL